MLLISWDVLLGVCSASASWRWLGPGMEYGVLTIKSPSEPQEGKLHIVRLEAAQVLWNMLLASELDNKSRTLAEWCRDFNLAAAINAGMFQKDLLTSVGYLRHGAYVQNRSWNKYKSSFAFNPRRNGLPQAIVVDLDTPLARETLADYDTVVQNLRLMKGKGINVWSRSDKKWSEAALGMDREGRILFLFLPMPFSMWNFIEALKTSSLGIEYLQHLEGGALAGLSIRTKDFTLDLAGTDAFSQTTGINKGQWPIPNVIGVQLK